MELIKKSCGIHYGVSGGQCSKCGYFYSDGYAERQRRGYQYNGVAWIEVLGEKYEQERQEVNGITTCEPLTQGETETLRADSAPAPPHSHAESINR